jgi:hypothetical protein
MHAKMVAVWGISNSPIKCVSKYRSTPQIRNIDPQFLSSSADFLEEREICYPRLNQGKATLIVQSQNPIHSFSQINQDASSNASYRSDTFRKRSYVPLLHNQGFVQLRSDRLGFDVCWPIEQQLELHLYLLDLPWPNKGSRRVQSLGKCRAFWGV